MPVIKEEDRRKLREIFGRLPNDVRVVTFTQESECEFCQATRELLEELATLSERITVEVKDLVRDADLAAQYGVDKIPATILLGERDYGIRFFGVPAGYEFSTLVQDIVQVGTRNHGLSKDVVETLAMVDTPVHIKVLVSPTCPYCPKAVLAAHRFALFSDHIRADMIEITEFPFLAVKYDVQGVPMIVINEEHRIPGALGEADLARIVVHATGKHVDMGGKGHGPDARS